MSVKFNVQPHKIKNTNDFLGNNNYPRSLKKCEKTHEWITLNIFIVVSPVLGAQDYNKTELSDNSVQK